MFELWHRQFIEPDEPPTAPFSWDELGDTDHKLTFPQMVG
jgi:hypothetical protein